MSLMRRIAFPAAANSELLAENFDRLPSKAHIDAVQVGCAFLLFSSPFWIEFPPAAAWNLWVIGYAMLTFSVAALVAEAEWEPQANLALGLWLVVAPWMLAFSHDETATLVHLAGGAAASILSALELWCAEETPPRRFGPAAARRAELFSVASATVPPSDGPRLLPKPISLDRATLAVRFRSPARLSARTSQVRRHMRRRSIEALRPLRHRGEDYSAIPHPLLSRSNPRRRTGWFPQDRAWISGFGSLA
jgi:hypothetical protein